MASKDSIGGLWLKTAKTGQKYMSGTVKQTNGQDLQIVVFKNDKGDNEKRPDYRIYLSEPKEGQGSTQAKPLGPGDEGWKPEPQGTYAKREEEAKQRRESGPKLPDDGFSDDIPF